MYSGSRLANSRGTAASLFRVEDEGSRFPHNPGTKLFMIFKLLKLLMKSKWL
jgi:hypothetical protein